QNWWPYLHHGFEARIGPDQPERDQDAEGSQQRRDNAGKRERIKPGHAMQRDNGSAERTKGNRCRIGEQSHTSGLNRSKSETDQNRAADGDRRSEARSSLKEGTEDERDKQQLETAVFRDFNQALLQEIEPPRSHRKLVHEDDGEDDPEDREKAIASPIRCRKKGKMGWHMEDRHSDHQSDSKRHEGRKMGLEFEAHQRDQQDEQGQCGPEG